jgi:hypothetical protein
MDIGEEKRKIVIEPLENPVPQREPVPGREPVPEPRRKRDAVPAGPERSDAQTRKLVAAQDLHA